MNAWVVGAYEIDDTLVIEEDERWILSSNGIIIRKKSGIEIQAWSNHVRIDNVSGYSVMLYKNNNTITCYVVPIREDVQKTVEAFLNREKDKERIFKSLPYLLDFAERLAMYMKIVLG